MLLSNHMYFIDFKLGAMGTFPHRVNNVVNIDGFYRRPWLLELIGAICTRKFTGPNCMTESKMSSKGTEIFCTQCGKRWNLNEDGTLSALQGETEFPHVPDWFNWEREQVRLQIEKGFVVEGFYNGETYRIQRTPSTAIQRKRT